MWKEAADRTLPLTSLHYGAFYRWYWGRVELLRDAMSWGEFIELRDLGSGQEPVDLSRLPCSPPRLERTNALRISPGKVPDLLSRVGIIRVLSSAHDPQITEEKGEGHNFQPCSQAQPTWCDLCGDFIWGLYKQSLRCTSESRERTHTHTPGCFCTKTKAYFFKECRNSALADLLLPPWLPQDLHRVAWNFLPSTESERSSCGFLKQVRDSCVSAPIWMQNSNSATTRCENPSFRLWRRTNSTCYTLCLCSVRTELSCHHSSLMVDGDSVFLDVCACWFDCCARRPHQTADSHATTAAVPWSGWTASGTEAQRPTTHALLNTPWRRTQMWWVSPESVLLVRVEAGEIQ